MTTGQRSPDEPQLAAQWARVRGRLQSEVGDVEYRTWLRQMSLGGLDGDEVTVRLPTRFLRDWVRTHYGDRLNALWQAENRRCAGSISASAASPPATGWPKPVEPPPSATAARRTAATRRRPAGPERADGRGETAAALDPRFTFDSFVVGKPNEFAYACARRVAEQPASAGFNPLFLYGGVGLGKTHLMHAIAWELTRNGDASRGARRCRSPTCRPRSSCTASSPPSAASPPWSSRNSCAASTC